MKFSLERHKEMLGNQKKFLEREEEAFAKEQNRIERLRQATGLYASQIELAEKEGKDGFDAERYAIARLCV